MNLKVHLVVPALLLTWYPVFAKTNIADLANRCQSVGDQNACRKLAEVAVKDKDRDLRRQAAEALSDQAILTKIAVADSDASVRLAAVRKLTDQTLLANIAAQDRDAGVHSEAVGRLTDQPLLAKYAMEDKDAAVRKKAADRVTDQSLLAKIAETRTLEGKALREIHAAVINYLNAAGTLQPAATRPFLSPDYRGDLVTEFQANQRSGWSFSSSDSVIESEIVNAGGRTATIVARVVFKGGATFMGKSQTFFLALDNGAWRITRMDPVPTTMGPGVIPLGK